jgi:hypothetical protein
MRNKKKNTADTEVGPPCFGLLEGRALPRPFQSALAERAVSLNLTV